MTPILTTLCPLFRASFMPIAACLFFTLAACSITPEQMPMTSTFKVIARDVFVPAPKGNAVFAASYYTRNEGVDLIGFHHFLSKSDLFHEGFVRLSHDNGKTWSPPQAKPSVFTHPLGQGHRDTYIGYLDPLTNRFILLWNEAVLANSDYTRAMRTGTIHYQTSTDGGASFSPPQQLIHDGPGYNAEHHLPDVTFGTNGVMFGDLVCRPLTLRDGTIVVPVQSAPPETIEAYRARGVYTFTDALVLFARWRPDGTLAWTASQRIPGDPKRSPRGWFEPSIAQLADGSLLMVIRGSNNGRAEIPGRRWVSRSHDLGRTWSDPVAWTFDDGQTFFSPSSCSQLLTYHDGRVFWIGNISEKNTSGNDPRYPLDIAEVDLNTGLLKRASLVVLDDRAPHESERLTLSNFIAREDRETGDLLIHLPRIFAKDFRKADQWQHMDWTSDALLLRVKVGKSPGSSSR